MRDHRGHFGPEGGQIAKACRVNHKGKPAIMDFKTTSRPKTRARVDDYRLQTMAYMAAHNLMFGTKISKAVIMMCSRNYEYQEFVWDIKDYDTSYVDWLQRVHQYYELNTC